jgi:SAM-dependent methyltransferase
MTQQTAVERWQELLEGRRRQMEDAWARIGRDGSDFWARRAAQYHRTIGVADEDYPVVQRVRALLPPGGGVLDVGAGTGRLALRLARHAGEVVAVEPQAAMAAYLTKDAAAAGLENIRLVQEGWLEAEGRIAPADIVLCAGVLFAQPGQADIARWLRTLDAHACVAVVLELVADWGGPPLVPRLWQRFHGEPQIPTSTHIDVYAVLHELGIPANVEVYAIPARRGFWRFDSLDDAVEGLREAVIMPATADVDRILRDALRGQLRQVEDGWELPSDSTIAAMIWWQSDGPRMRDQRAAVVSAS